jgi:hypothetical protein
MNINVSDLSKNLKELPSSNIEDLDWQKTRFEAQTLKLLWFKDNVMFSLNRFEKGCYTHIHQHAFWQLRYILEGEFIFNGKTFGPGELVSFPEKTPYEGYSPTGGTFLLVQMPGPTTGIGPTDPSGIAYGKPSEQPKSAAAR